MSSGVGEWRRSIRKRLRRVWQSERGAAYSAGLAITLPFYAVLIGFLVEWATMLNVQVGVDYAAWSAARSAAVWIPAEATRLSSAAQNADMVRRAAVNAISAWASSNAVKGVVQRDRAGAEAIYRGYQSYALGTQQSADYVLRKWHSANSATRVEFDPPLTRLQAAGPEVPRTVRVTVHYEMPFQLPGIGLLLGRRGRTGWVRDLRSTVELSLERPRSRSGRLGIEYDSRPVR